MVQGLRFVKCTNIIDVKFINTNLIDDRNPTAFINHKYNMTLLNRCAIQMLYFSIDFVVPTLDKHSWISNINQVYSNKHCIYYTYTHFEESDVSVEKKQDVRGEISL